MEHHARRFDDALAEFKRSLEARPGNFGPSDRPPGGPGHDAGTSAPRPTSHGGNALGKNPRSNRANRGAGAAHRQAGTWFSDHFKVSPLTAVIIVMVAVVAFQQAGRQIDRRNSMKPEITRLLFAPGMTGERGL